MLVEPRLHVGDPLGGREILLTDGEDVTEKYYGVVVSRVRKKIELVEDDFEALEQHETLADELRDVVCSQSDE